jgi:hypothetical protein
MRSWLRHVKGCQFAELNWKPSGDWIEYDNSQQLMDKARSYFQERLRGDLFEGTKTASQLVKQGEIDVLGIKLDQRGVTERLYSIDIAFHEGGLNYRDVPTTTNRVIKKIVRSFMISRTYFGQVPSEFVFASPRVGNSFLGPLHEGITHLRKFLAEEGAACEVVLLANREFRTEVLEPTLKRSSGTADSSELFLRSYRLWRLFDLEKHVDDSPVEDKPVLTFQDHANEYRKGALPIQLEPADIQEFKDKLLNYRKARVIIEFANGTSKEAVWIATKFKEHSNLFGNLKSRPEFRQGEWQKRGIARLRVIVDDQSPLSVG